MTMKILISGDRDWEDDAAVGEVIYDYWVQYGSDLTIITGGARGADTAAETWTWFLQQFYPDDAPELIVLRAEWNKYGKSAGPIRNREMLNLEPDKVIGFHNDIENSKGTKDCLTEARKRDIEWILFSQTTRQ